MDKVVIITGGAKASGAGISRASIREGAIAVIIDRDSPHRLRISPGSTGMWTAVTCTLTEP